MSFISILPFEINSYKDIEITIPSDIVTKLIYLAELYVDVLKNFNLSITPVKISFIKYRMILNIAPYAIINDSYYVESCIQALQGSISDPSIIMLRVAL